MSSDSSHFLARKFQDFQRQSARSWVCPECANNLAFTTEQKLWDHANNFHREVVAESRDSLGWKKYLADASAKSKQKPLSRLASSTVPKISKPSSDDDSMKLNLGDETQSPFDANRPLSTPTSIQPKERKIGDLEKLSLSQCPEPSQETGGVIDAPLLSSNPKKRAAAAESGSHDEFTGHLEDNGISRNRRAKALSGGSFVPKDPEFNRQAPLATEADSPRDRAILPNKRLFDPNTDNTVYGSNTHRSGARPDQALTSRQGHDARIRLPRAQKVSFGDQAHESLPSHQRLVALDSSQVLGQEQDQLVSHSDPDAWVDPEPQILLQPETRPITHDQLVVEVKGIYAGLVMVEAKCIDVDEKQAAAAQRAVETAARRKQETGVRESGQEGLKESAPNVPHASNLSHESDLTREQWQALIALHKTLLHEHHDFFLASQHPSASSALSRLAAKYSMPARMWRHGIHAFLEVLRQRLPESLEHMLAFIYIAYSMMALLYETVPTFEDTWIECLGDLGRYRMAIEDSDQKNREVWTGVAQFWYGKAADKSPNVGRLYHHLAILARPYTLQQLSLYLRALTCILPFESAKGSIMTLFKPILDGRAPEANRLSSVEIIFIKSHGLLFTNRANEDFTHCVQELLNGLMDSYIGRVTAKFKEQGVYAALSNIASLFEYGVLRSKDVSRSIFRLAFDEVWTQKRGNGQRVEAEESEPSTPSSQPKLTVEDLTPQEFRLSMSTIVCASIITFGTLNVALRRIGDKNVYPLVHTYLVFIRSLVHVEKAMKYVETDIPWLELAVFLNALDVPHIALAKVSRDNFPRPDEGIGRPLPEDFVMRGQLWSNDYFPHTWFLDAKVDDEERTLELPSFAAPRIERMVWLGHQIVSRNSNRWMMYSETNKQFTITPYANEFPKREVGGSASSLPYFNDADSAMSGFDELENEHMQVPDSPVRYNSSPESETAEPRDVQASTGLTKIRNRTSRTQTRITPSVQPKRILTKENARTSAKVENTSPPSKTMNPDSVFWVKGEYTNPKMSAVKHYPNEYASDPRKLELINFMDLPDCDDSNKA